MNEFTNGALSARLRLFKDSGVNGVTWNGKMHNTDGREFDVSMNLSHAKSPTDPTAGDIQPSPGEQAFSKTFGLLWAGGKVEGQALDGLSPWELKILRNAIFARHGRTFESGMLSGFFHGYPGYKADPGYNDGRITPTDRTNADAIKAAEPRATRPSPDTAWNALRGFLDALAVGDAGFIASLLHPSRPVERVMFTLEDPPQVASTKKLSEDSKELKNLWLDDGANGESYSFMMSALWDLTLSAQHAGGGMFRNKGSFMEVGFTEISGKWWLTRVADAAP